jgi:co-chaperonin GroES (HSP10)
MKQQHTKIRPLRGRVVVREIETLVSPNGIVFPSMQRDWDREADRNKGIKAMSSHRGIVLDMGPPARTKKGAEISPGFRVGDTVQYKWTHNEREFTKEWSDGKPASWISQDCVLAVIE